MWVASPPSLPHELIARGVEVGLIAQLRVEGSQGLCGGVLVAVEAPVYEALDAPPPVFLSRLARCTPDGRLPKARLVIGCSSASRNRGRQCDRESRAYDRLERVAVTEDHLQRAAGVTIPLPAAKVICLEAVRFFQEGLGRMGSRGYP